jgi:protein-S-isoprenylcysteine O-methyltransferase Ste14
MAVLVFAVPATSASSIVVLKISAALLLLSGSFFLSPSYSVIPAFRSLAMKGPYRLVRHPIYASYLISPIGYRAIGVDS